MADSSLLSRLDGIEARFEEVSTLITDPSVIADMKRYVRLTKEYKDLEKLTNATRTYRQLLDNIKEAREILETESDEDLRSMAKEELDASTERLPQLEEEIKLLTPKMAKMLLLKFVAVQAAMRLQSLLATCLRCIASIANQKVGAFQLQVLMRVQPADSKKSCLP